MSDFRAIGGTSATLQTLLSDRMELPSAVASAPVQNVAANPYGTFAGYQLIDATTGGRTGSLACNPAGLLTPAAHTAGMAAT